MSTFCAKRTYAMKLETSVSGQQPAKLIEFRA